MIHSQVIDDFDKIHNSSKLTSGLNMISCLKSQFPKIFLHFLWPILLVKVV